MSSGARTGLIIVVIAVVVAVAAYALGLFSVNTSGELKAPEISVEGGALPNLDVDTGEVVVGTTETQVEVPDVDVSVDTKTETVDVPTVGIQPADKQ
jgi:regulator of protease activity HflC (stomatin/prohibitin superfamily)